MDGARSILSEFRVTGVGLRAEVSHPFDKNKYVEWMGHGAFSVSLE
jgi:hypothetical protein